MDAFANALRVLSNKGSGGSGDDDNRELEAEVQEVLDSEKNPKTTATYEATLKRFTTFLKDVLSISVPREELASYLMKQNQRENNPVLLFLTQRYKDGLRATSLRGERTAFTHCVRKAGFSGLSPELEVLVKSCIISFRKKDAVKKDAVKKVRGEMESEVGKAGLAFTAYKKLCSYLLGQKEIHALLIAHLSWSLINRVNETLELTLRSVKCGGDHLLFAVPRTKCDQVGERQKVSRVFANPKDCSLCPFTALGLLLLTSGSRTEKLFSTAASSAAHQDCFRKKISAALIHLGVEGAEASDSRTQRVRKKYGSHSIRKGAATYACSICNRGGWSTGVLARYITTDASGDAYVGRALTGLANSTTDLALLPPHFAAGDVDAVDAKISALFSVKVRELLDSGTLRLVYASLCHHKHRLLEVCGDLDVVLIAVQLPPGVTVKTGLRSESLQATGVPPFICHAMSLELLQEEMSHQREEVRALPDLTRKAVREEVEKLDAERGQVTGTYIEGLIKANNEGLLTSIIDAVGQPQQKKASDPDAWGTLCKPLTAGFLLNPKLTLPEVLMAWFSSKTHPVPYRLLTTKSWAQEESKENREKNRKLLCDMRGVVKWALAGFSSPKIRNQLMEGNVDLGTINTIVAGLKLRDGPKYKHDASKLTVRSLANIIRKEKRR